MNIVICIIVLLASLVGCGTNLAVTVDIFDQTGLSENDYLEAIAQRQAHLHAHSLKNDVYGKSINNLNSQMESFVNFLVDHSIVADEDSSILLTNASTYTSNAITDVVSKRKFGSEQARLAINAVDPERRITALKEALQSFHTANRVIDGLYEETLKPFQSMIQIRAQSMIQDRANFPNFDPIAFKGLLVKETNLTMEEFEKNARTLTGGNDLFADPLASFVIATPEKYWKGVYNQTKASGQIGNTDIAIKMETIGTFTIKGLRLDASKVTAATFEVLKQSVRMVAAAYGIPVPSGTQPATGDEQSNSTDFILQVDQMRQDAELKRHLYRNAALTLLDIIISERADLLSGTDATRKAAVTRVKESFESYKSQLQGE